MTNVFELALLTALLQLGVPKARDIPVMRFIWKSAPKAYSYEGEHGQLTVNINPEWEAMAKDYEIGHVARHEACHMFLHQTDIRNPNHRTPERIRQIEREAETCAFMLEAEIP